MHTHVTINRLTSVVMTECLTTFHSILQESEELVSPRRRW